MSRSKRKQLPVPRGEVKLQFNYGNHVIRTVQIDDEIWFVANDVCQVLEYADPRQAIEILDDDEKGACKIRTLGGSQDMNIINESGLYHLIFRSHKPQAKDFRRKVTMEILPAIRKTGRYEAPGAVPAKEFIPPLGKNPFIRRTIEDLKTELLKMSDPTIPEAQLLRRLHSTENQKNFIDAMQFAYGILFLASLWDRVVVDEPVLKELQDQETLEQFGQALHEYARLAFHIAQNNHTWLEHTRYVPPKRRH